MKHLSIIPSSLIVFLVLCLISCQKNSGNEFDEVVPVVEVVEYDKAILSKDTVLYFPSESNKLIEFRVGSANSPVILSSPHDGTIAPSYINDRKFPDAVVVRDIYATPLTERISDTLFARTGARPHVIINNLARTKMDPNRSLDDAYLTHYDALEAWNAYQKFIKIARQIVTDKVGKGLYLDIHGHGHTKARIEVGYMLTTADLNKDNDLINLLAGKSSIFAIAKANNVPFSQLIRGEQSFGTLLENEKHPAVPSNENPTVGADDYFNGGYCTATYGSLNGGNISAIQLETSGPNERNSSDLQRKGGGAIAKAVINYFRLNYGMNLQR